MHTFFILFVMMVCAGAFTATAHGDTYQEAFVLFKSGQMQEALQGVDSVLALPTPPPRAYELKGRILHVLGRHAEAQLMFFEALEQDPSLHSAHFHLGEAAFRQHSWGEAIEYYQVHLRNQSGHKESLLKIIYCLLAGGNFAQATQMIGTLDPLEEFDASYYFARAALAIAMGKLDESAALLQQVRTLYGNETFVRMHPDYLFILRNIPKERD